MIPQSWAVLSANPGQDAYFLPAVAYLLIVVFAVAATRAKIYQHGTTSAAAGH